MISIYDDMEDKIMNLSNKTTKLFIHRDLLAFVKGREQLQDYFHGHPSIPNHTIFKGIREDGSLDIVGPTFANQNCTLTETSFGHSVAQNAIDDYVYASYETFLILVG